MTKPDLPVEAHLLAALKREMQRRPDEAVKKAVAARLSVALGTNFDPTDLAGVDSATAAVGSANVAASAAATGVGWVQPLVVLVASATISTGALFGIREVVEPAAPPAVSLASQAPAAKPSPRAAVPLAREEVNTPVSEEVARGSEPAPTSSVPRASSPKLDVGIAPSNLAAALGPSLRDQQALLDTARRALARQDGAAALEALGSHRARFPKTALEEEREALTVKALRESGRTAEASERARRFSENYPRSVFLPGVRPGP